MKLITKFWENSPKTIFRQLKSKFSKKNANPVWTKIEGGPLKGSKLFLDVNSFFGWKLMVSGDFDKFIYEKLKEHNYVSDSVFWDVGAHFGYHSLSFASLIPTISKVYSFEPNPFNAKRLQMNVEKNQQSEKIIINQIALSKDDDVAKFNFSKSIDFSESSGSHLVGVEPPLSGDNYTKFEELEVTTRRIDSLISEKIIEPAQIVKIDVEGAEMLVLEGGKSYFNKYKPLIFMEVHNITMMCEVSNYLHSIGYQIEIIDKESSSTSWCFICASPIIVSKNI